jgi:hypothetical protein
MSSRASAMASHVGPRAGQHSPSFVRRSGRPIARSILPSRYSWNRLSSSNRGSFRGDRHCHRARIRHFPGYSLRTRPILMRAALLEARARAALGRGVAPSRERASSDA